MTMSRILLVEQNLQLQQQITEILGANGYTVVICKDLATATMLELTEKFNLAILNTDSDPNNIIDSVFKLQQQQPELPVLMLVDYPAIEKAVLATQAGAVDYLVKPFMPEGLLNLIRRHAIHAVAETNTPVVEAKSMRLMLNLACKVAKSSVKVLISGETGSGKKTMARYIHAASMVSDGAFITINCASSHADVLESVLFGYKRKNSSGVVEEFPGKLELSHNGTVVLDEIAELPMALQDKLLTIFRERVIRIADREKVIPLKARIIATTSKDLHQEVRAGNFNEDLYFMLSIFPIKLPSLKDRKEDVIPLAEIFLQKYAVEHNVALAKLTDEAMQYLVKRTWTNNINELKIVLGMAVRIAVNGIITPQDLTSAEFDELSIVTNSATNNTTGAKDLTQNNTAKVRKSHAK